MVMIDLFRLPCMVHWPSMHRHTKDSCFPFPIITPLFRAAMHLIVRGTRELYAFSSSHPAPIPKFPSCRTCHRRQHYPPRQICQGLMAALHTRPGSGSVPFAKNALTIAKVHTLGLVAPAQ